MKQIISFGLAVGLSLILFVIMNLLIENEVKAIDSNPVPAISFDVMIADSDTIISTRPKPPELKPLKKQPSQPRSTPSAPPVKPMTVALATGAGIPMGQSFKPNISSDGILGTPGTAGSGDSQLMPRVRINPMYSSKALREGKQGFVTLRFDIDQSGSPFNIEIIEAEPRGYFEASAKKALRKWRYNPQKKEGVGVMVYNQQVTLEFKLEE